MANNEIEGMDILKLVAVAGAVPAKQVTSAKKNIPVGEHHVSGLFRIDAKIKKGEDVVKPVVASLPTKLMVTALLSNMGEAQRKAFILRRVGSLTCDDRCSKPIIEHNLYSIEITKIRIVKIKVANFSYCKISIKHCYIPFRLD